MCFSTESAETDSASIKIIGCFVSVFLRTLLRNENNLRIPSKSVQFPDRHFPVHLFVPDLEVVLDRHLRLSPLSGLLEDGPEFEVSGIGRTSGHATPAAGTDHI